MPDLQRIKKDCFWDYNLSDEDIIKLANSKNRREQQFLFEKILLNSRAFLDDLKIFKPDDLKNLIENYKVPKFNEYYAFKRKNMAEVYFLNKPLKIDELKWQI